MTTTPTTATAPDADADADVRIDADAPVVSRHEIVVDAPLQVVWDLHTDIAAWPSWHSDVEGTQLRGPLAPGAVFRWQTAGLDITSTIAQVDAPHRIVWGGPANGITGVHVWTLTRLDAGAGTDGGTDGGTGPAVLVRTEESWDGEPVREAAEALQLALDTSLRSWLGELKATAEARSASHR